MDLFKKENEQCEKVADSLVWPTRLSSTLYDCIQVFIDLMLKIMLLEQI